MKYFLILLVASGLLTSCSFKLGRQIASIEDDIKKVELKRYNPIQKLGINLTAIINLRETRRSNLYNTLEKVRSLLLDMITLQNGSAKDLPVEDFFIISEQIKDEMEQRTIDMLLANSKALLTEVKKQHDVILEQIKLADFRRIEEQKIPLREQLHQFNIKQIEYYNSIKLAEFDLENTETIIATNKRELDIHQQLKIKQERLIAAFIARNNLNSDTIIELNTYEKELDQLIQEQVKRRDPQVQKEMLTSVAKCMVPETISSTTDCEQAKIKIKAYLDDINKDLKSLQDELLKMTQKRDNLPEGMTKLERDRVELNKKMINNNIIAIESSIKNVESEINAKQIDLGKIDTIISLSKIAYANMLKTIDEIKVDATNKENEYLRIKNEQVIALRTNAITMLRDNAGREEALHEILRSFIISVTETEQVINQAKENQIKIKQNIKEYEDKIKEISRKIEQTKREIARL